MSIDNFCGIICFHTICYDFERDKMFFVSFVFKEFEVDYFKIVIIELCCFSCIVLYSFSFILYFSKCFRFFLMRRSLIIFSFVMLNIGLVLQISHNLLFYLLNEFFRVLEMKGFIQYHIVCM